ncbi:MAG TPA: tetratricopeptide repeat protein, partial [Gaiellaceae bacterium]|nr:tetratricopeptide repeat protein [Gaiellaceae bacterium]
GGRHAEAWRYSVVAGDRAREKWANVEAAEFYQRALEAVASLPAVADADVARVWEALAACLQLAGRLEEAAVAFGRARRLTAKGTEAEVVLLRSEGALREAMGKYSEALRWYGRGLKAAGGLPDEVRLSHELRLRLQQAQVKFRQGSFGECIRAGKQIAEEALAHQQTETLAATWLMLHVAYTYVGSRERFAFSGLALPLFEELGDLRGQALTLLNLGVEAYYEGDWEKALNLYERSRVLFRRIGDVSYLGFATNNIGEILSDQGKLEEATGLFDEVVRLSGRRDIVVIARGNLGRAAARAGRFTDAQDLLREALEEFRQMHAGSFAFETELRLGELEVLRGGDPEAALLHTRTILEQAQGASDMAALRAGALRVQAAAQLQLGDADGALGTLRESLEVAREAGLLYEVALAQDLLGAACGDAAAAAEAAALLERLGVQQVARGEFPARL